LIGRFIHNIGIYYKYNKRNHRIAINLQETDKTAPDFMGIFLPEIYPAFRNLHLEAFLDYLCSTMPMIRFEEALDLLNETAFRLSSETVGLRDCSGRILAADVFSDMDIPPFNKSAVDGYACRRKDLGNELEVIEIVPAGKAPENVVKKGQCSKLMTGGMVPEGADTVIMIEDVEEVSGGCIRFKAEKTSVNIACRGEDIKKGDLVLHKGKIIRPQDIAVLASSGCYEPVVSKKPKLGIISTGDELVEPSEIPGTAQIRNSNAWQLIAQAEKAGCAVTYYGIIADSKEATLDTIEFAASSNDILVLTGGVSVGDFDFVPEMIQLAEFNIKFHTLAVQPGKPSIFAVKGDRFLFGLPGNPVSSFVQFELLVGELIKKITGNLEKNRELVLSLSTDIKRRNTGRKAFVPVRITGGNNVIPVEYHGSAHIHSYIEADGIIAIEIGQSEILKGTQVHVRLL
jgi:molybdopterin molybdotransferase